MPALVIFGYARVSTADQKLDLQSDAPAQLGCHRVFENCASGARTDRQGLAAALPLSRTFSTEFA
jgi:DNA invertase Pin-like site-specific DNA recombinase